MDEFFVNKHTPKDIENLLKELFLHKKMGAEAIMNEIVDDIHKADTENNGFEKFKKALNQQYPSDQPTN